MTASQVTQLPGLVDPVVDAADPRTVRDGPRFGRRHRALRVCMVHFSDYHIDGRIQRQAMAIGDCGGEVECVCLSPSAEVHAGAGLIRLHQVDIGRRRDGAGGYLGDYARFLVGALRVVTRLHRQKPFDVVEIDNMPNILVLAAVLPKLRGTPVMLDVHDTFPELFETTFGRPPRSLAGRAVRLEERVSAALADALLVVTEEARLRLESRGVGAGKTSVCMNSPDESVFGAPREPVSWIPGEPLRAVYHGGIAERFGPNTLIAAFADLAADLDVTLDVYGTGDQRDEVAAAAARLAPGRVRVAPHAVPHTDIPRKLAEAHFGIVPTIHDPFTELLLPVKLLEYVHVGLPVICSRLPCIEHYFSDDELVWFESGDSDSLADAIRRTVADPTAARERAVAAQVRLRDLAWSRQREQYLVALERLAGRTAATEAAMTPAVVAS